MENESRHDVESINHDLNWLKTITIEIDKFLINHEYVDFFMKMYMQWSKDYGSTSSFRTLIIPRLPRFEILDFSQFKLYIETQKMTQCFVCCNFQKTILIRSTEGKETFFCILRMLRIHTGLRGLSKTNVYDLNLKKRIHLISVKHALRFAKREVLFEKYIMALNREIYDIEVQENDAIKRN